MHRFQVRTARARWTGNAFSSVRRLTDDEGTVPALPWPPDFWVRAQKFPPTTGKLHPRTTSIVLPEALMKKRRCQLSRQRGWARLGELVPTPSASPTAHFFPRGKVLKTPWFAVTGKTEDDDAGWRVRSLRGTRVSTICSAVAAGKYRASPNAVELCPGKPWRLLTPTRPPRPWGTGMSTSAP